MNRPIKLKIQNAINRALQGEIEDSRVFVGGRRRNRKKRRNKNNQKNKKNTKKEQKSCNRDELANKTNKEFSKRKDIDQKPLINSEWQVRENKDFDDIESRDSGIWTPELENENLDSETMPFAFLKRKPSEPKASPVQEAKTTENVEEKPATETVQVEKSELSREISNCLVNGEVKKPETESEELTEIDGGAVVAPIDGEPKEETAMVDDEKADVELVPVVEQQSEKPKVESTPLIKRESDAKGTQPGFLCCTIL